jgi:hypothetical protein
MTRPRRGLPTGRFDTLPLGGKLGASLVEADLTDKGPGEADELGDASVAEVFFFMEFPDLVNNAVGNAGAVMGFTNGEAVFVESDQPSH